MSIVACAIVVLVIGESDGIVKDVAAGRMVRTAIVVRFCFRISIGLWIGRQGPVVEVAPYFYVVVCELPDLFNG
jgi:hypothetical protein